MFEVKTENAVSKVAPLNDEARELSADELNAVSGGSKSIQTEFTYGDTTIVISAGKGGYTVCTYKDPSTFGHCTHG